MHISRYALCLLLLAMRADVCLAAPQDYWLQESVITTVAGNGQGAFGGDGGPATEASLNMPGSVAVDAKGNVYIADWQNQRIRKINPAGIISTVRAMASAASPAMEAPPSMRLST
jgi:NHL repeat